MTTTYVLAGSYNIAISEARDKRLRRARDQTGRVYEWFLWIGPNTYNLEGRNILKGDRVLFGYGTTVDMLERFITQAQSRGTQLSDLEIIT